MEPRSFAHRMGLTRQGKATTPAELKAEPAFFPRIWGAMSSVLMGLPRSNYHYAEEIGDGLMSSSVMPAIQWIMRVFPEAQPIVERRQGDDWEPEPEHPLLALLARPNDWYDGNILWMVTCYDYSWFGNSYWHILRDRGGQPGELWWMPPWSVMPQWPISGGTYITSYTYTPVTGGPVQDLSPDEVVHFRYGLDPRNPRLGLPPLRSVLREIWSDEEASNFVASLLRNSAVTSTLITPDPQAGEGAVLTNEQAELIKAYVTERFTGDSRGVPMTLNGPLKVQRLGFAPNELDLSHVRNTTEERVCAALGVRAAVVGFGTGLEQTKVGATMHEETTISWTNGIIPMQRVMGTTLGHKLLPLYAPEMRNRRAPETLRFGWEYSQVRALQEDEGAKVGRLTAAVQGGIMRRDEARTAIGLESEETDKVYLIGVGVQEVPMGEPMAPPLPRLPTLVPREDGEDQQDAETRSLRLKGQGRYMVKVDPEAIYRIADRLEPQMRNRFLAAVQATVRQIDTDRLDDALRIFDAEGAAAAIPWQVFEEQFGQEATRLLREAVGQTGAGAARELSAQLGINYRFDVLNLSAVEWANQHAGRLIKEISQRTEDGIRELVAQSLRGEWTWQQVARQVRATVGLTERQALAVQHFEQRLRQEGAEGDRLVARVERYAAAQLKRRGETIARTEIMTAASEGQRLAWTQAELQGLIDGTETFRVWIATEDERLEAICEALDGQEAPLHGSYPGGFAGPPAHINCRCTEGLNFHRTEALSPLAAAAD